MSMVLGPHEESGKWSLERQVLWMKTYRIADLEGCWSLEGQMESEGNFWVQTGDKAANPGNEKLKNSLPWRILMALRQDGEWRKCSREWQGLGMKNEEFLSMKDIHDWNARWKVREMLKWKQELQVLEWNSWKLVSWEEIFPGNSRVEFIGSNTTSWKQFDLFLAFAMLYVGLI